MTAHPAQLLVLILLGLVTLAILLTAGWVLYQLTRPRRAVVIRVGRTETRQTPPQQEVTYRWSPRQKATLLALAAVMFLWVFAGKYLVRPFFEHGDPTANPAAVASQPVQGGSGASLVVLREHAAVQQPGSGTPTLVLTHGWGADHREWDYLLGSLKGSYDVVRWDLPGLGSSSRAPNYALETLASDLDRVVQSVQGPVILVGHSIGGMLMLEYARRYPDKVGTQVQALVLLNTTYTNPVETKKGAELSRKLQKPVYEPLLHLVEWTAPVARGLGWLAYRSGLAHLQLASQSFGGSESWTQLDHMASYAYRSSPGVVADGVLGMLHWDAADVLPRITVPTLVVSGDEDTTTLPVASDRMEREIPSARRISVPQAAHLGPVERHDVYADAISSFAASIPRRP